jgi:hypothetical protein
MAYRASLMFGCFAAVLLVVSAADGRLTKANLGLTQQLSICDGKATYGYAALWNGAPGVRFQVNSGNQCKLAGAVCGISSRTCYSTCDANGQCSAQLSACQVGRGSPWVKVTAMDGTVFQQITAMAPSRCQ